MVESWSDENGPSAGSALVHKERAKVWDGGPSKPWCPAGCKVLEFSRVWNGCTTGFLLTQERKKKNSNQVEISSSCEVEEKVDGKK